mgnify:CR=1 FL=1
MAIAGIPRADEFGTVYDQLLELADEHLTEPVSAKVDAWEDGTYRVLVYHHIPPDQREGLYFHSDEGVVRYGIEDNSEGELKNERVITTISPSTSASE